MSSSNRVAIVTGSAQGIGRGIALRLARDGFNLVINDIAKQEDKLEDLRKEIISIGEDRKCVIAVGDVTSEEDVKAIVDKAIQELGGLDVMVANAGISAMCSFLDHTVEIFDRILSVNVRGIFLCFKYAASEMIKQGRGGKLIAAASIVGRHAEPFGTAYNASKFAVRGIVQTAALELGQHGITANAYAPGAIDTAMFAYACDRQPDPSVARDQMKKRSPLNRIGKPEDIAGVVSYLASPDGDFVTGQTMGVDGGWFLS